MNYRITIDEEGRFITIQGVLEVEEELFEGYGEKVVSVRDTTMEIAFFFEKLKKAVLSMRTIAKLEKNDGKYFIEWLEQKKEGSVLHRDTLEVSSSDRKFTENMDKILRSYKRVEGVSRRRVFRNYAKSAGDDDVFKKCWNALKKYGEVISVDDVDKKKATEMYAYLQKHEGDFVACPVRMTSMTRTKKSAGRSLIGLMMMIAAAILVLSFTSVPLWYGLFSSVWAVYLVADCTKKQVKKEKEFKIGVIKKFVRNLEGKIDYDYFKSLSIGKTKKTKGFVTLVKKVIKTLQGHFGDIDIEGLRNLGKEYSREYMEQLGSDNEELAIDEYVMRLLDYEIETYAHSNRCGAMSASPSVGFDHLYEVLECIGWEKEVVLTDEFIKYVRSSMRTVIENPYEGCEVELLSFVEIAVGYAKTVGVGKIVSTEEEKLTVEEFRKDVDSIFDDVCRKITETKNSHEKKQTEIVSVPALTEPEIVAGKRMKFTKDGSN